MLRSTQLLAGIAAACLLLPVAASAQSMFDFSYANANGRVLGAGTFTASAITGAQRPSFLVTGITGTYRNADITGLLAAGTFQSNDNILYYPSTFDYNNQPVYLDLSGIAFSTTAGTGSFYFGLGGSSSSYQPTGGSASSNIGGTFTVRPLAAAVPEAATWAMMIAGFGFVGGAMRYGRKTATIRFA